MSSMSVLSKQAAQFFPMLKVAGEHGGAAAVALNKPVCVVGRTAGVNLPLASTLVSKLHALLVRDRKGVYVRDLASRNGTVVNGEAVREAELGTGDVVKVGPFELRCASGFDGRDGAVRAPEAALKVRGGDSRVPLKERAVLIGRRAECDVVLDDPGVSAVHAVVFELDGKRFVRDLNSGGGTLVNGETIHQHELVGGDEIVVGGRRIAYVEGERSAAEELPAPVGPGTIELDEDESIEIDLADEEGLAPAGSGPEVRAAVEREDDVDDLIRLDEVDLELEEEADDGPVVIPAASAEKGAEGGNGRGKDGGDPLDGEELLAVKRGERPVGLIDALAREAVEEGGSGDSEEAVAIPMASEANSDSIVGVPLAGETPGRMEVVGSGNGAGPEKERAVDDGERGDGPDGDGDLGRRGWRRREAARKLDQIVSTLSERVTDLETTWEEVKGDAEKDGAGRPPGAG